MYALGSACSMKMSVRWICCACLARYNLGKKPGKAVSLSKHDETVNFWPRVEAVFDLIDLKGDGNGLISRAELIAHFRGNTAEADYHLDEIEGRHQDDVAITMEQWCVFHVFGIP